MAERVAMLMTHGFEEVEMTEPRRALEAAGMTVDIVAPGNISVLRAWDHSDWGQEYAVDVPLAEAKAEDYDALMLPGGVMNPDKMRRDEKVQRFIRAFFEAGKPVAAICHAPWVLIDAGVIEGRRVTSYPSLQMDLKNAGADWVDQEVVVDRGLVTSRNPDDLPAFNAKMVEEFREGIHAG